MGLGILEFQPHYSRFILSYRKLLLFPAPNLPIVKMGVGVAGGRRTLIAWEYWENTIVETSVKCFDFLKVLHTASAENFIDSNFEHSKFPIFMSLDTIY